MKKVFILSLTLLALPFSLIKAELEPLALHLEPQDQTVQKGESAIWYLTATGDEPLHYQWFHQGQVLEGETNRTLSLVDVTDENIGEYYCEIKNRSGKTKTEPVQLVLHSPSELRSISKGKPAEKKDRSVQK